MTCKICNSTYHKTETKNIKIINVLRCIAANLSDLIVTLEVK